MVISLESAGQFLALYCNMLAGFCQKNGLKRGIFAIKQGILPEISSFFELGNHVRGGNVCPRFL